MNMTLNGNMHEIEVGITVGQLLDQLSLQPERVVIELNRNILNAVENNTLELHEGDTLEIIQFVGGG